MNRKILHILLVIAGVFVLVACQTSEPQQLNPDWLITKNDLAGISENIGIIQWQLKEDMPGTYRVCRVFEGVSWSVSPNAVMNCANTIHPDNSFEQVIESMYDIEILLPTDIELEPVFFYNRDFALYAHMAGNGHSVYDAFVVDDGVLFGATVTLGTPGGYTPETLFAEHGPVIETFLWNILKVNLEKSSAGPLA